ncbi:hypothetical protein IAU60_005152 [Kwoniella sp. DSM 27419]
MLQRVALRPLYSLKVRQQPERARLCSYKEENETIDRRPVDPPPVVELRTADVPIERLLESTSFFIRATIVSATSTPVPVPDHGLPSVNEPHYTAIKTPTGADATTGEVVQTPEKLRLLDGRSTALCIFAKLSVRVPGVFRLMFTLYETTDAGITELTRTVSEPFEVFSPKLFKGMHESTPLTRHLAAQGLKVKLRTDTSVGRQSTSRKRTPAATTPTADKGNHSHTGVSHYPFTTARFSPMPKSLGPNHPRKSTGPTAVPHRALVWKPPTEPYGYSHSPESMLGVPGPGPTTIGKRRYMDDGSIPSLRDISPRFDWTPTPPATDLSAFSLSRHGSPSGAFRNLRTESPHTISPTVSSQSSSNRSLEPPSRHGPSPFSAHNSSRDSNLSLQTRRSSNVTAPSSVSSIVPSPFPRLNIGPGDDGVPILPLPSMFASSSSSNNHRSAIAAPFVPPSVHQVLESSSSSSSHSLPRLPGAGRASPFKTTIESSTGSGSRRGDPYSSHTGHGGPDVTPLTLPPIRPLTDEPLHEHVRKRSR